MRVIQSIESEKAIIGGLLLDSTSFTKINKQLCPNDFTLSFHQDIFKVMCELMVQHKCFDAPMVCDALGLNKQSEKYIYELANCTASTANIKAYADIVREKSVQRQLVSIATDIANTAKQPGNRKIEEILDDAEARVRAVNSHECSYQAHLVSFLREVAEEIECTSRDEFCESYLQFTIVEVNKALVDTLRHVEETHPDNYEGDEDEHH